MHGFVVDASTVLATLLPDETNVHAMRAMDRLAIDSAVAPVHWPLEVANGLLVAQRRRRITDAIRRKALAYTALLPVELDVEAHRFAWGSISELAAQFGLTTYDAAYLELAIRLTLPLATLDDDLYLAAKKAGLSVME